MMELAHANLKQNYRKVNVEMLIIHVYTISKQGRAGHLGLDFEILHEGIEVWICTANIATVPNQFLSQS
jgi:hypothetical protein